MKKVMLVFSIIAIMFTAGCENIFGGQQGGASGKGVSISFLQTNNRLSEGLGFQLQVRLQNHGINPVNGELCLSDELPASFGGIESARDCQSFGLSGNNEGGDSENYNFPSQSGDYVYRDIEGSNFQTDISAVAVYNYRTSLNPQICLSKTSRGCASVETISGARLGDDAASSPVTISKIQKTMTSGSNSVGVTLEIHIANVGGGRVVSPGNSQDDRENVEFNINFAGTGFELRCLPSNSGVVTLDKGSKIITCNGNAFFEEETLNTPLDIELQYSYRVEESISGINIVDTD